MSLLRETRKWDAVAPEGAEVATVGVLQPEEETNAVDSKEAEETPMWGVEVTETPEEVQSEAALEVEVSAQTR